MIYNEIRGDLFDVEGYHLAHCVSQDSALGQGIAVQFQAKYQLRKTLQLEVTTFPDCILVGEVFNLITKEKYWHKPTYQTLSQAIMRMKKIAVKENITKIAMPQIGCGLDRLSWHRVKEIIHEIFKDTDIEILVVIKE